MKDYKPSAIEKKWQDYWDEHKTYKVEGASDKSIYVLDMFPYPSGSGLHVGHPLGYTGSDIYSRFRRMQGYQVLHPMGFDAFGLPAEQHAVKTGEHPAISTAKNCEVFTSQLKMIGFSYDWDRSFATCDSSYYKWTQWIFLRLYNSWFDDEQNKARPIEELPIPKHVSESGELAIQEYRADRRLAYMDDSPVNWCPALGTVLANEEVIDGRSEIGDHDVVRKMMRQWKLRITKYSDRLIDDLDGLDWPESIKEQQRNWIGKSYGTEIDFLIEGTDDFITAFTTRPDTLFGVTFFVVSPEHPFVKSFTTPEHKESVESYCEEALKISDFNRTIENREKTGVFTGSYVTNPISRKRVPIFVGDYVLMSYGTGAVMGVPAHDERDFEFARKFQLEIKPVIAPESECPDTYQQVIDGEISWTKPGTMIPCMHNVAKEIQLEGKPNKEAGELITAWLTSFKFGRKVVQYKLRDWLFSRQRYWGEPIPIVHWEDGRVTAVDDSELPLELPEIQDYKPAETGESPLAKAGDWLEVVDDQGRKGRRETNTMPQWAGSCWYYLRFIDPHNEQRAWDSKLEKTWSPVDLYIGGAEHAVLHLLYARFWHKVLYDLGHVSSKEPFQKLFNQGMLQAPAFKNSRGALVPTDEVEVAEDGTAIEKASGERLEKITAKMSKSLRNVVTNDEIVSEYGADTLRMYLMFMGPLDSSRVWDSKAIMGNFRFLKKVWSIVTGNEEDGIVETVALSEEPENVTRAIHKAIKKVSEDYEELRFNTAVSALMELVNEIGGAKISKESLEALVLIAAPMAPHIGEELWQRLGNSESVALATWPDYNEEFLKQDLVKVVVQVNGKKRGLLEIAADISEEDLRQEVITGMSATEYKVSEGDRFITVCQPGSKIPKLVNVIVKS